MKKQLRVGNLYLADMRPMSYYRNEHLADYRSDLYTYLAIAGFFLANAFWPYWVLSGSVRSSVVKNWPSVWLLGLRRTVFRLF